MLTLKKKGIYRVIGKKYELLINVIGEEPCLRIISAINITETVKKGTFVQIEEESEEIQEIYANPKSFVFFDYEEEVDLCFIKKETPIGVKTPELNENTFDELYQVYRMEIVITGRKENAVKAYIRNKYHFTDPQINRIVKKLAKTYNADRL